MAEETQGETRRDGGKDRSLDQGTSHALRRRYLTEGERTIRDHANAITRSPTFVDHGDHLSAHRTGKARLRDMAQVARHRGWTNVVIEGRETFRRLVWVALSRGGLEVDGYRPNERERQAVARLQPLRGATSQESEAEARRVSARQARANQHLAHLKAVVDRRIADPERKQAVLSGVRERLDAWACRGVVRNRPAVKERQKEH